MIQKQSILSKFENLSSVEEHSYKNKTSKWKKLYFNAMLNFLNNHFNTNINVKLDLYPSSMDALKGSVNLNKSNNVIRVSDGFHQYTCTIIAHEFTHLVQVRTGRLTYDDVNIIFDGKPVVSINDYQSFTEGSSEYKNIPFEKEAYENQRLLYKQFRSSKYYSDLYGKDPTLNYILDDDLI